MSQPAATLAATVLIPTHNHGDTLRYSVPTALHQTVQNIEIFIVGDGVPDVTRTIAREFAASDPRVQFFDFPKGPGRGELHRHRVLQDARGEIVCYLFDDDLWLPDHVAVIQALLRDGDFAFTMPVVVTPVGTLQARPVDLARPVSRALFTNVSSTTASVPTCAGHTLASYRRLPWGWRTAPRGCAPDKYMWAQFLADKDCIARSTSRPTAIIFPDPPRRDWAVSRRLDELQRWSSRLQDPEWQQNFLIDVIHALARESDQRLDTAWWLYGLSLRIPIVGALLQTIGRRLFGAAK